jgi:hypothetical protein
MFHDIESFIQALTKQGPTCTITLTNTMLNKSIIDANKTVIALAASIGVDFSALQAGEKITIAGRYDCDGQACSVSFYRTKARGDKRFSISGLKKRAGVGDAIAITHDSDGALVINATRKLGVRANEI